LIRFLSLALWLVAASGAPDAGVAAHLAEVETWRAARLASLRRSEGWLTLIGLFWLEPGENRIGSDPASRAVLPAGRAPARLGTIELTGSRLSFRAEPGVDVTVGGKPVTTIDLEFDASAQEPTVVRHGSLSFYVIKRGDRFGLRVKDSEARALREFRGLENFPFDESLRFVARFEPYEPAKRISVPNILGRQDSEESPGAVAFERNGKTYRLDAVREEGTEDLFIIFGDATNGHETYGGGRFLYAAPPKDGHTVLDFNKAYNPPCVFTPYATCPLPPAQNRLTIRIEAGEKSYEH
jgi:hypothetical protein